MSCYHFRIHVWLGITPMLQVLEEIFRNPQDKTKVTLVYANQTPNDILLKVS
jgi:cytochrome-b5 reductase